ncbi:hypothetical protein ACFPOC_12600 [Rubellimicrobium aerolatum]|uniref:ABC transmembrane type-1 domain-containing protein n=1 Tax=Rubellimicrobium aerolatum TaxID=490979 RepID=A0ABW0SF22_9RHOB
MTGEARGWGYVAPALLWTGAFFLVPFAVMAAMSLARLEGREVVWGLDWGNYAQLAEPHLARAVVVSLEITGIVTVLSVLLAIHWRRSWPSGCRSGGRGWRCCWRCCRSGPRMSCGPIRGCWCCRGRGSSTGR